MLVATIFFWQVALAVHIIFVVAAFGLVVSYPFIVIGAERIDRRSVPVILRLRKLLGRSLVNPGLAVVVIAGVYLAAYEHQWHYFYVQWGIGAVVVLGALEGSFVIRQSGKLAELAQRDIDAAGASEVMWSDDYLTARGRADQINVLMTAIVVATIFFMAVHQ